MQKLMVYKAKLDLLTKENYSFKANRLYYGSPAGSKLSKNYISNVNVYLTADKYIETCLVPSSKVCRYAGMWNREVVFSEIGYILYHNKKEKRRILSGLQTPIVVTKQKG